MDSIESMPGRGQVPADGAGGPWAALTAEEFAARFEGASRVLWTVAAGVLGDPSEAEDVLQEACLMALGKLDRFQRGTSFTAWTSRFVRNVALNHARKRQRRATRPEDPEALARLPGTPPTIPGPGAPVDRRGKLSANQDAFDDDVLAGLHTLAPLARACLLLRTILELSYREIATTLEIPEGTAMSHVHRARASLRDLLGDEHSAVELEETA